MNYRIVIPTYKREQTISIKTLALLRRHNIPYENIDILVEDQEQVNSYLKYISSDYNFICHYQKGIGAVRNWIRYYYKHETNVNHIVSLDDDIDEIMDFDQPMCDLNGYIEKMFNTTANAKLNYWGVSNLHNTFYMTPGKITTGLKYIAGAFNGEIIARDKEDIQVAFDTLEDFAFTCEFYLRDDGVIRDNGVWLKTKYFNDGGICETYGGTMARKKAMEKDSIDLCTIYGDMVKRIEQDYGYDIKINSRWKKPKQDYIIVIPSYNREKLIYETTIPLLIEIDVPIYILVDEKYKYDLPSRYKQIVGPRGIGNVRNFIRKKFNGKKVLMIDDDIESIDILDNNTLRPIYNLKKWINQCWETAEEQNVKLWGVNLYHNSFFCRKTMTTNLCYINGSFTGIDLTEREEPLETTLDHFEDYDFSIQHFLRDGKVLKFNDVCLKTKCFRKEGGIAEELGGLDKRKEKADINGQILLDKYPDQISLVYSKKFKITNIKLSKKKSFK